MPDRRKFLKYAASGVTFAGRALLRAQSAAASRRTVSVSGRRVRTVDIHAHCVVPEALALMGNRTPPQPDLVLPSDRLRAMDEQGIDVEALSINPFWYGADRDLAARIISDTKRKARPHLRGPA